MSDSENIDSFNNIQKLMARLLTFPMLTVAAINGIIIMVPSNLYIQSLVFPKFNH